MGTTTTRIVRTIGKGLAAVTAAGIALTAFQATAHAATVTHRDATASIQNLLNHPVNGVVNLPSGTFTVRPTLRLNQSEKIVGHHTTLKVAASSGNYAAVLSGVSPSTNLSGLSITGVTFDQNTSGNPIRNVQVLYHGKPRFVILVDNGTGISITNDKFVNTNNINTVVTGSATSNVNISGNTFTGISTPWHDHSSIYTSGTNATIRNNTFIGSHDIAAIEVHGNGAIVTGNTVKGYYRGANIVANNTTFRGNTVIGALGPIDLWSTVAPGLHNVTISGNKLNQDLAGWSRYLRSVGIPMPSAPQTKPIFKEPISTFPFAQISIGANHG
jgi:hypothetical protein